MKYLKGEAEDEWYEEDIGIDFVIKKAEAVGVDWLSPLQKKYYDFGQQLQVRCRIQ